MYIYVDILIITNIYIDFLLIKATARLSHSAVKNSRCIAAAAAGSLFSLIILLPELNAFLLLLLRVISAAVMVAVSFGKRPFSELYKIGLMFFFVSFVFAGIEYAAASFMGESSTVWHNTVLYVNISLLTLVISTIAAYAALCLLRRILDGGKSFDGDYTIIIMQGEKHVSVKAACDTCNNLTDVFSGKPVIICSRSAISPLFEEKVLQYAMSGENTENIKGWRIIPYNTVNSGGLMPSFRPAGVYIKNNESGRIKYIDAYVGVVERELEHAVFNPKIIG